LFLLQFLHLLEQLQLFCRFDLLLSLEERVGGLKLGGPLFPLLLDGLGQQEELFLRVDPFAPSADLAL
jgi:hypothetical protein